MPHDFHAGGAEHFSSGIDHHVQLEQRRAPDQVPQGGDVADPLAGLADGGGRYVLWYSPLLILMALRPTTVDLQPPSDPEWAFFGWLRKKKSSVTLPTPPTLAM